MKVDIYTNEKTAIAIPSRVGCIMLRIPEAPYVGDVMMVTVAIKNNGYGVFDVTLEEIGGRYQIRGVTMAGTIGNVPEFGIVRKDNMPHIVIGNPINYFWDASNVVLRSFDYVGAISAYAIQDGDWGIELANPPALPALYPPRLLSSIGGQTESRLVRHILNTTADVGDNGPWDIEYTIGHLDVIVNGFELTPDAFIADDGTTFTLVAPLTLGSTIKAVGWTGM